MTGATVTGIHVSVAGARLFVRVAGDHSSPRKVLLLHGGGPGTCGDGWLGLIDESIPGCQLYAPDFLGFGYSDAPDGIAYGFDKFTADTLELITLLCLEPVVLVGHSMGAAIAAAIAVARPDLVTQLILIAPGGGTYGLRFPSAGLEQIGRVAADPSEANMRALVGMMSHRGEHHDAEIAKRMALIERPGLLAVQRHLDRGRKQPTPASTASRAAIGEKLRAVATQSAMPVALLWGAEERFNPGEMGEKIRDALPPHAQYRVIAEAGHNVHYDQPRAVAKAIAEILG